MMEIKLWPAKGAGCRWGKQVRGGSDSLDQAVLLGRGHRGRWRAGGAEGLHRGAVCPPPHTHTRTNCELLPGQSLLGA